MGNKRRYPTEQFQRFFVSAKAYAEATRGDEMIHRSVAGCLSGLREFLEVERKRVPGRILYNADRQATMLFSEYDPFFEGDEPPGQ